jgi:hypothetical protein
MPHPWHDRRVKQSLILRLRLELKGSNITDGLSIAIAILRAVHPPADRSRDTLRDFLY